MTAEDAKKSALALAGRCALAMVGSNGDGGFPNVKAMIKMENEGLGVVWFSTNTSSKRVAQFRKDPRACVYFMDAETWEGLMLVGKVEVLDDDASRKRLWRDGFERYYPGGVTDPDYSVLRFSPEWANYYHSLANVTFGI
jgi:general stress protein 26